MTDFHIAVNLNPVNGKHSVYVLVQVAPVIAKAFEK